MHELVANKTNLISVEALWYIYLVYFNFFEENVSFLILLFLI